MAAIHAQVRAAAAAHPQPSSWARSPGVRARSRSRPPRAPPGLRGEPRTRMPAAERSIYLGLSALIAVLWLAMLPLRPLFNPDEGRYAEIPREMVRERRLDRAAPERPRVHREAPAAVLGDGALPRAARGQRIRGPPVYRALRRWARSSPSRSPPGACGAARRGFGPRRCSPGCCCS